MPPPELSQARLPHSFGRNQHGVVVQGVEELIKRGLALPIVVDVVQGDDQASTNLGRSALPIEELSRAHLGLHIQHQTLVQLDRHSANARFVASPILMARNPVHCTQMVCNPLRRLGVHVKVI